MTIKQHGGIFGRNPTFNEIGGTLTTAAQPNITSLGTQTSNLAFADGNGIDFSATGDGSGTTTSELFDDYEIGTYEPVLAAVSAPTGGYTTQLGRYIKVGNLLYVSFMIEVTSGLDNADTSGIQVTLPFAIESGIQGLSGGIHSANASLLLRSSTANTEGTMVRAISASTISFAAQDGGQLAYTDCNTSGRLYGSSLLFT